MDRTPSPRPSPTGEGARRRSCPVPAALMLETKPARFTTTVGCEVRYGSEGDIALPTRLVRFVPSAEVYSITSSAPARIDGGMTRPSACAVFMFTTSSKVVGCTTGRSAGAAPLRILPT
jgi:hypothetical protein